jgi:hypothetical protein
VRPPDLWSDALRAEVLDWLAENTPINGKDIQASTFRVRLLPEGRYRITGYQYIFDADNGKIIYDKAVARYPFAYETPVPPPSELEV